MPHGDRDLKKDPRAVLGALRAEIGRLTALREAAGLSAAVARDLRRAVANPRQPPAPRGTRAAPAEPLLFRRSVASPGGGAPAALPALPPAALEEAVANGREERAAGHALFVVRQAVRDLEGAEWLDDAFRTVIEDPVSPAGHALAGAAGERGLPALGSLLFLDIETTGLTSSPLFLIGVMDWDGRGLEVRQYFARHYAEEGPVVRRLIEDCAARERCLVTFNGRTFDWPYIVMRAAALGLPPPAPPAHLDLLVTSRRHWKKLLPDCRLQTLERHVCGRGRSGDIPGSEIPAAYHAFVRTGDARRIADAIRHNMLDLITLADLMTRLPPGRSGAAGRA
jgi:hypothetical protein